MSLVNELIKNLLPEQEKKKVVAVYGGGFKPPTKGHFEVVKTAIEKNPEIDEFIINIGGKERDGVTPEEAILIWDIYKQYLPVSANIDIKFSNTPPIKAVYDYAKNNPDEDVLFILGAREGNEDDFKDIATRTKSVDNYPNLKIRTVVTQGGASGTAARNAAKEDSIVKFKNYLPDEVNDQEAEEIYGMVTDKLTEGRKKKKDPKKGTGKKPKKSGRRLYTDEDPKDTIGVKFSTRQDIVNTLNKKSFKAKSHARQSQIINLIHQRVRAALARTKDPQKKSKLNSGFKYIKKRKEASKAKTQRLKKKKLNEKLCKRGKAYIAKRKREGEKHNPFLAGRAVKVCKGQMSGVDGKQKKDFRPKKGKKRSAQGRKPDIVKEIGINLSNYSGQVLPGDVLRAPKGFPLGGKKLDKSLQLKVIKNSREGVNRYKLSLEDSNGKRYTVRNFQMDGEYKGKKLPKWGMVRRSKENLKEDIDSSQFDFNPYIASLTQYFIDNKMAIEPLPKVEMVHNDVENGEDVFGKTAYYMPDNNVVVLFTYGRHPKDILRSYAHELVHVHQNMENRLHNVNTTDVNEDEYLEQLEREAYETGNILFRSWTDSLTDGILSEGKKKGYKHKYGFNPKLGKDPFGLNAYARELALGLEEQESDYKVYLDMDGVIANFDQRFEDISGMKPHEFESKYGKKAFWNLIDEDNKISFWVGIKPMPGAKALVDYVKKYNYELLTSPSSKKQSYLGKILWVRNNSGILGGKPRINFKKAKEKHQIKNNLSQSDILIDDRMDTIERWNNAGGTGIHYESASQVLSDLKKLGL